ncbi:hypothetical protein [Micromonospora nigra]|nr:hypothetical protein [Micromonospora nigra]
MAAFALVAVTTAVAAAPGGSTGPPPVPGRSPDGSAGPVTPVTVPGG